MSDERQEEDINDPLDDEFDAAMDAATQLAVHAHRIGMQELELPVGEDGNVWVVNIRKLGIRDEKEHCEHNELSARDTSHR